ncbi:unnamed protein product [Rotaria socialis]|uniref:Uncharacterized protein n=1 Tax=Rotaria socialis TaxID=392032 RepID=A0A820UR22_9BILA|nr:unnamed protein product [Rotaria socialis]CAF4489115.1 unnamed protein product [Rotaria socialis]
MRTLVLLLLIAGYICSAEILVNNIRASSTGSSSGSTSRITTKPATTTQKPLPTTTKPATTTQKPSPTTTKPATTTQKPLPTTPKSSPRTTPKPLPTTPKSSPRTTPKPSPTTSRILSTTPRPSLTTTKFSPTSPKLSSTSQSLKTSVKPSPTATSRTPAPKIIDCYYCGDPGYPCPQPFNSYDRNVRITPTSGRFCVKLGPDNGGRGPFYRKPASSSECSQRGCSRKYINFQWTEVCCCDRNKCNMGIASAKSTWGLIFSTLAVIFIYHQF